MNGNHQLPFIRFLISSRCHLSKSFEMPSFWLKPEGKWSKLTASSDSFGFLLMGFRLSGFWWSHKAAFHFFVPVSHRIPQILVALLVGPDPLIESPLAFVGNPYGLIHEAVEHLFSLVPEDEHAAQHAVNSRFLQIEQLLCHSHLVHLGLPPLFDLSSTD
jgi:hypothetical protein